MIGCPNRQKRARCEQTCHHQLSRPPRPPADRQQVNQREIGDHGNSQRQPGIERRPSQDAIGERDRHREQTQPCQGGDPKMPPVKGFARGSHPPVSGRRASKTRSTTYTSHTHKPSTTGSPALICTPRSRVRRTCQSTAIRGASRLKKLGQSQSRQEASVAGGVVGLMHWTTTLSILR